MNDSATLSDTSVQRAMTAVTAHPLYAEATAWGHCPCDVFTRPKGSIDRTQLAEVEKTRIRSTLADVESYILVAFWTSDKKPEPLAGFGKLYAFLVHPRSFAVLHASVSTWRS